MRGVLKRLPNEAVQALARPRRGLGDAAPAAFAASNYPNMTFGLNAPLHPNCYLSPAQFAGKFR